MAARRAAIAPQVKTLLDKYNLSVPLDGGGWSVDWFGVMDSMEQMAGLYDCTRLLSLAMFYLANGGDLDTIGAP